MDFSDNIHHQSHGFLKAISISKTMDFSKQYPSSLMDIVREIHGFADGYCLRNPWLC
jgi:hypothetical protein